MPDGRVRSVTLHDAWRNWPRENVEGDVVDSPSGSIGFFVDEGEIFVLVGCAAFASCAVDVRTEEHGYRKRCSVSRGETLLFEHVYIPAKPMTMPMCWPEEDEDVDPFLWLSNVINSPERMEIVKRHRADRAFDPPTSG